MTAPRVLPPAALLHLVDLLAARGMLPPTEAGLLRTSVRHLAASEARARVEVEALRVRVADLTSSAVAAVPRSRLDRHAGVRKPGATPDDARRIAARLEAGMRSPRRDGAW